MANTIIGKILGISPVQNIVSQRTGKTIVKRELVIDATRIDPYTGERGYENTPKFDVVGEKCVELDKFSVGQIVEVTFYLQGRQYVDKQGMRQIMNSVTFGGMELRGKNNQQVGNHQQANNQSVYAQQKVQPPFPQQQAPVAPSATPQPQTGFFGQNPQTYDPPF